MNISYSRWTTCLALAGAFSLGIGAIISAQPLVWDATIRQRTANPGETNLQFVFKLTNASATSDVVIIAVKPSCGCTATKLPALPWRLAPGRNGQIEATVDIRGKRGVVSKIISVESTAGTNVLTVVISIPEDRARNMDLALADRQAVFRGDCAACHVQPAVGKKGAPLYQATCAICHESDHRATMVPNLMALNKPTDRAYWEGWVRHGKAGSLMPAFAKAEGGPLDEDQIKSLVDHLADQFTATLVPAKGAP